MERTVSQAAAHSPLVLPLQASSASLMAASTALASCVRNGVHGGQRQRSSGGFG